MKTFTIYPAIDLRRGRVVRLEYGDPDRQTVFSDDPVDMAKLWAKQGADWLHVVNLDGAFEESGLENWEYLPRMTCLGSFVQFGGGLRVMADVERALDMGVSRVILGTAAVKNPQLVADSVSRFGPERVAVGLDAREGRIKIRGWRSDASWAPVDLARQMAQLGLRTAIHTDIDRDGVLTGVNVTASADLARRSGLEVIASGGVAALEDVRRAKTMLAEGLTGVVIGRALYDGRIDLSEALGIARGLIP